MKELTFEETPEVAPRTYTITEAWANLFQNPSLFVRHWNYKGAIMSGLLRAPIFLITYLVGKESLRLAIGAALVQFSGRAVLTSRIRNATGKARINQFCAACFFFFPVNSMARR